MVEYVGNRTAVTGNGAVEAPVDESMSRNESEPDAYSTGIRPGIPRDSGHGFHSIPASGSERSDAVNCPLPFSFCSCQVCSFVSTI
ncbi:MAG TPA: hypothetical protein ENI82_01280 [Bacteroidetes bacterium]|nr:hypothetical protein [Bacteroidota bacterium]